MAQAQGLSNAIPAEFPPSSYSANQYVDSTGCAFIRAGVSGAVTWVPRVSRNREQLCGFQPSIAVAAAPEPVPTPAPAPIIEIATPAPEPAPAPVVDAPAPAPAPVVAAAPPRPRNNNVGAPTTTVASIVTAPTIGAAARTVPVPAAVSAPAPATTPAVAAPQAEPAPISQAEACAGLSGVQPNLINARTGRPIDCGPAPRLASVPAAVTAPVTAPVAPQANQPLRMTLSEVCARIAATGQSFINQATGQPIVCPQTSVTVASAATPLAPTGPAAPAAPVAPPVVASAAATTCPGVTYVGGTDRYPLRCGPQALSPSMAAPGTAAPSTHSTARAAAPTLGPAPVPASNPVGATAAAAQIAPGYRAVWDDGRVNPNRGVPRQVSGAVVASQPVARVSTRSVPQAVAAPQATSHRYVQVGTYGDPGNAQRAVARLRGLGLPVGVAQASSNGRALQIVAAGPFSDAGSLQSALRAARSAGYGDAFTRR